MNQEAIAILQMTDDGSLAQGYGSGALVSQGVLGQVLGIFLRVSTLASCFADGSGAQGTFMTAESKMWLYCYWLSSCFVPFAITPLQMLCESGQQVNTGTVSEVAGLPKTVAY